MAFKMLEQRILDAFAEDSGARGYADKYLDRLIDGANVIETRLRRLVGLTALLIVAFFLISGAKKGEVTLGPFKATNLSAMLTLIPAAVTYLLFELVSNVQSMADYQLLRDYLVKLLYPSLYENDLHKTLTPVSVQFYGREETLESFEPGLAKKLSDALDNAHIFGLLGAMALFTVYAYVYLFSDSRASVVLVSASVVFAAVNVVRSIAVAALL